jgi:hypothetical protein
MSPKKLEQFRYEGTSWIRTVDYLQQENIMLKNRLAQIMQYPVDKNMLEQAEVYQNIFLGKDAILAILRHDIKEVEKLLLAQKNGEASNAEARLLKKQLKLRQDMEKMENEFNRIKKQFNGYLAEAL